MAMRALVQQFGRRPALLLGAAGGIVAGIGAGFIMATVAAVLVGWCVGIALHLAVTFATIGRASVADIRKRAEQLDDGRVPMLVLTVAAAIASMVANLVAGGGDATGAILAGVTVLLSWTFVHVVFALHYAHDFYLKGSTGGLKFEGEKKPLYWDFMYVAFTVGTTAQVSDTVTTDLAMRKLVLAHGVVSFFFNTAILALGVNLAAGLLR